MRENLIVESAPDSEKIYWNWVEVDHEEVLLSDNIRPIDYDVVGELVASISENGQLQPCLGDTILDEEGIPRIRLIAGQHRYHAIHALCSQDFDIKIILRVANRELTPEEVLSIQMSENLQNKMTPEQDAVIIHEYWQRANDIYGNLTLVSLSKKLGRSPRKISEAIKYIEDLSPKVQQMVDNKVLSYSTALLLSKLGQSKNGNEFLSEQVREAIFIISQGYNTSQARKYLEKRKNEGKYLEPLFTGEVWESLKSNGYKIAIKDRSSKEGRQAVGWFVRMIEAISLLDNPSKVEFSEAIERAVTDLGVSLDTFNSSLQDKGIKFKI